MATYLKQKYNTMALDFSLSSQITPNGRTAHYAALAGNADSKFFVGYQTHYKNYIGLENPKQTVVYDPQKQVSRYGFWAYFIYPTAIAESKGSFSCLNTYDRAQFTFGFMQYAAHVPNGDFVRFFRKLLSQPNASDYFPKLELKGNHIFYKGKDGSLQLENESSTQELMNYLNPSLNEVDKQELICSARFVHWAMNDPSHVDIQIETATELYKNNMIQYHNKFNLEGVPDYVCQVICDIRHQGRGNNAQISQALDTNKNYLQAYHNLLEIGGNTYQSRIVSIQATIDELISSGVFSKKYHSTSNSFL
ncbi:hypothetical protein [Parabacteroides sp. FAFU027]|uniref:hypothetical protein n=1 Tax=Parabacteroides sp. FAFU027 TaxID=2922715 RepID=UPI001FAFF4D4|nr:hypothetical protein [Parabacteroides sp. FAFU027]